MVENVDRRVLGAIRLVDGVTGVPVARPMRVAGEGLTLLRNRAGLYVIMGAEGLANHATELEAPPATPGTGSLDFTVQVEDPTRSFMPRA